MINNKKILFIPGWMNCVEISEHKDGIDIWEHKIDFNKTIEADFVVAHSIGAVLALHYWENNKNLSLILTNPLISKKKLLTRFIKSMVKEKTHMPPRRIRTLFHIIPGIFKLLKLLKIDSIKIIKQIPKEKLLIIRGKEDKYLCDEYSAQLIKSLDKNLIELNAVNHNYSPALTQFIENYIQNS